MVSDSLLGFGLIVVASVAVVVLGAQWWTQYGRPWRTRLTAARAYLSLHRLMPGDKSVWQLLDELYQRERQYQREVWDAALASAAQ